MSCHKSFGSSDKLGLKVVIRPLLGRQARKLAPLENVDKATSRRAFPLCPYRRFNNRLKFSLRRLILKKKKEISSKCYCIVASVSSYLNLILISVSLFSYLTTFSLLLSNINNVCF